jgi:hypothetical protein
MREATGSWTFPWIFVVVCFPLAALGFWYNTSPDRVARAQARRDARLAKRAREIHEARRLRS